MTATQQQLGPLSPLFAKTAASQSPSPKLPTAPSTAVKDADLVSPASPIKSEQAAAVATQQAPIPKKSLLKLIEEHFVQVDDLRSGGAHFPWRGVCKKCGWHTHQFNQEDAFILTRSHAQTHWRDVQRFM